MRQKLWTLVTQCLIIQYLEEAGLQAKLVGQGDNQVLLVNRDLQDDPRVVQMRVLHCLEMMSRDSKLPIKIEGMFSSEYWMEYGKKPYFVGIPISMGLKKASHIGTESTEVLPLNTRLSSIYSTAVPAAGDDPIPGPAFKRASCESAWQILGVNSTVPSNRLALLLMVGRNLGGLKINCYSSFCVRGHLDGASANRSLLKTAWDTMPHMREEMSNFPARLRIPSESSILKDPYTLAWDCPKDPDQWVRSLVEEELPQKTQNQVILPLLTCELKHADDTLVADLFTMQPRSLKLMSFLYNSYNVALKERLKDRFATSTSVSQLVNTVADMGQLHDASERDADILEYPCTQVSSSSFTNLFLDSCSTRVLDHTRRSVISPDLIHPSVAPPQEQAMLRRWSKISEDDALRAFRVEADNSIKRCFRSERSSPNIFRVIYKGPQGKSPSRDNQSQALQRSILDLAEVSTWVGTDENLQRLIKALIQEKASDDPQAVIDASGKIVGRAIEHRIPLLLSTSGAYINFDPNITSYIVVNTDSALAFARKQEDYTLFVQMIKLSICFQLMHLYFNEVDISGTWAAVIKCESCTLPIHVGCYSLPAPPIYEGLDTGMNYTAQAWVEGTLSPSHSYHAYLGRELASVFLEWNRYERVMCCSGLDPGATLSLY